MTASTMSLVAIAAVAAVIVLAASPSVAAPQSMANFGKGNINAYLMDPMLVRKTISCVEGVGPCTRLGNSLKSAIPTVLNNCKGCDQQQAANARKLIDYIQRNYPRDYDMILAKYRTAAPARG